MPKYPRRRTLLFISITTKKKNHNPKRYQKRYEVDALDEINGLKMQQHGYSAFQYDLSFEGSIHCFHEAIWQQAGERLDLLLKIAGKTITQCYLCVYSLPRTRLTGNGLFETMVPHNSHSRLTTSRTTPSETFSTSTFGTFPEISAPAQSPISFRPRVGLMPSRVNIIANKMLVDLTPIVPRRS